METNNAIETAAANLRNAEAAHAACLKYSFTHMRVMPIVDDATLAARYAAVVKAARAYRKVAG